MKSFSFSGRALTLGAVALLTACGASQALIDTPAARETSPVGTHAAHTVSWMLPEAKTDDLLYVSNGAWVDVLSCLGGCGTLFEIGTSDTARFRTLHSFSKKEGTEPGGLTTMDGALYGVTYSGGNHNDGTVFEASLKGMTRVLHNFGTTSDGKNPVGQLLVIGDTLYGATWAGGSDGKGTVYTLRP